MDLLRTLETFVKEPIGKAANSTSSKIGGGKPRKKDKPRAVGKRSKKKHVKEIQDKENLFKVRTGSPNTKFQRKQGNFLSAKKLSRGLVVISTNRLTQKLKAGIYEQGKTSSGILRRNSFGINEFQQINDELHRVLGLQQSLPQAAHTGSTEEQLNEKQMGIHTDAECSQTKVSKNCLVPSPSKEPECVMDHTLSSVDAIFKPTLEKLLTSFPSPKVFGRDRYMETVKKSLQRMLQSHSPEVYKDLTDIFLAKQTTRSCDEKTQESSEDNQMDTGVSSVKGDAPLEEPRQSPVPAMESSLACTCNVQTEFQLLDRINPTTYSSPTMGPLFDLSPSVPEDTSSLVDHKPTLDFLDVVDHDQHFSLHKRRRLLPLRLSSVQIPTPPKLSPHKMF